MDIKIIFGKNNIKLKITGLWEEAKKPTPVLRRKPRQKLLPPAEDD